MRSDLLIAMLLVTVRVHVAMSAPTTLHVALTDVSIQSGLPPTLDACADPDGATCLGGLASVVSLLRKRHGENNPNFFFLPTMDMFSAFVQVHPKGLGINAVVFKKFGIRHYIPWHPSFASDKNQKFRDLAAHDPAMLFTNAYLSPAWYLYRYPVDWIYGSQVVVGALVYPNVGGAADGAKTYQEAKERREDNLPTVIVARFMQPYELIELSELAEPPELVVVEGVPGGVPPGVNKTTGFTMIGRMPVVYCLVDLRYVVGTLTATFSGKQLISASCHIDSVMIGPESRDALYYTHQAYLQAEGAVAAEEDKTIGSFLERMPPSPDHQADDSFNNLVNDAFLWESHADIAFLNGGAIMGEGLAAGPVKMGDIFSHFPWPDAMCRGTFIGAHIFELVQLFVTYETDPETIYFNYSYGGMRLHYDINRAPAHRLLSIDVKNRTTGAYHPLQRTKLYSWVTLDYSCLTMNPLATEAFKAKYRGETSVPQDSSIAQVIIASFINATSPVLPSNYSQPRRLSLVDPTFPSMVLAWNHTQNTCIGEWLGDVGTCVVATKGSSETGTTLLVVVIVVSVVGFVVIAALVLIIVRVFSGNKARDVKNAPKANPVCIIFTDVEKSTNLWTAAPHSMQTALDMHFEIIRRLIRKYKAYEVKTIGDAFMIAVGTPDTAVALAHDIQLESQKTRWPKSIFQVYETMENEEHGVVAQEHMGELFTDMPDDLASNSSRGSADGHSAIAVVPFTDSPRAVKRTTVKGLRVRIGIHIGSCDIRFDRIAKGYDYFGTSVNCTSRIESKAQGGQTLISAAVKEKLTATAGMNVKRLGCVRLRGISGEVEVFEIFPNELAHRSELFDECFQEDDPLLQSGMPSSNRNLRDVRTESDGLTTGHPQSDVEGRASSTGSSKKSDAQAILPTTPSTRLTPFTLLLRQSVPDHEARDVEEKVCALAFNVGKLIMAMRPHEQEDFIRRLFIAWRLPPLPQDDPQMALQMLCLRSNGSRYTPSRPL